MKGLKWAAMRAVLCFIHYEGQSRKTVSINLSFFKRKQSRSGESNRCRPLTSLYNALPLGHSGFGARVSPVTQETVRKQPGLSVVIPVTLD